MRQETVRRLLNTSVTLPQEEKDKILTDFAGKLKNSGYSEKEIRGILVEGIIKFEHLRWKDMLPQSDKRYQLLHLASDFNKHERKLKKFTAESNWYLPDKNKDHSWRQRDANDSHEGAKHQEWCSHILTHEERILALAGVRLHCQIC